MQSYRFLLGCVFFSLLIVAMLHAQTPTPVSTGAELAVLVSDGTQEFSYTYTGSQPYLTLTNIGSNPVTIRLSSTITETTPSTPTHTLNEFILASGASVTLPREQKRFYHRAESAKVTSISVIANDRPAR